MTPPARAAAAIAVLDRILGGEPAERALTNWARGARYAGSSDRAEVRDLVFQALRCRSRYAAMGGGLTGRGLVLGLARDGNEDPSRVWFTGGPHAPAPPDPAAEAGRDPVGAEVFSLPDWLEPPLRASLGAEFTPILHAMETRAPVFLRVNTGRTTVPNAMAALLADEISATPHPLVKTALHVIRGERKIQSSQAYTMGLVELQDVSSQAVVQALPLRDGHRVLDLCAGGGGKTLAMAAAARISVFAHDAAPRRMTDLPVRAGRAGVAASIVENPEKAAPYDLVLTDVPCSGSGSWRRDPEGKWRLTPDRLADLLAVQDTILTRAAAMVAPNGTLAYATCSFLRAENEDRIAAFLARNPGWDCTARHRFSPLSGGDGFFLAILTRA